KNKTAISKNELQEKLFSQVVRVTHSKRTDSKKGNNSRFNDNSSADFHKKTRNANATLTHKGNTWYFGF
ncbi:hypothetical protein OBE_03036, partial [human gut metagenome]